MWRRRLPHWAEHDCVQPLSEQIVRYMRQSVWIMAELKIEGGLVMSRVLNICCFFCYYTSENVCLQGSFHDVWQITNRDSNTKIYFCKPCNVIIQKMSIKFDLL